MSTSADILRLEAATRKRSSARMPVLLVMTVAMLAFGYWFPTQKYITPQSGLGYALGIVGGSAMLLLLVYPARKRMPWLAFLGSTRAWFRIHMVLGIAGPLIVLYHANFRLGATNSNVALACMLIVSGSGLFGRYVYTQIHHGLYGRRATLAELREHAEHMRTRSAGMASTPELVARIDEEEGRIVELTGRIWVPLRPLTSAIAARGARRRLHRYVKGIRPDSSGGRSGPAGPVAALARTLVDERIHAVHRVVTFGAFERLFSLWHALHLPLFVMLLVSAVVHVIAVHVY